MPPPASSAFGSDLAGGKHTQPGAAPAVGSVTLYDIYQGNDGHRAEYYALLQDLIGTQRTASFGQALFGRQPVLIGAIETSGALSRYALLALLRAALGRRTAALLFRPLPAIAASNLRLRIKRWLLGWIKQLGIGETLTILPFDLEPGFARIASSWIYDPQFWDLHFPDPMPKPQNGKLAAELRERAGSRRICCAIGRQDHSKGFDQFVRLYCERADLREKWLFAVGGTFTPALDADRAAFETAGGFTIPRFIEREELLDLYAAADLIWCSYAPDYDQASGIFGRAKQFGCPVVVREGSLIHRFCVIRALPHLAYSGDPAEFDLSAFPDRIAPLEAASHARAEGHESLVRLKAALGLD